MGVKLIPLNLLLLMLLGGALSAPLPADIFPYPYHEKTLDNGLKVVLIPMENTGLIAYYSIVRTGSRDEYEKGHTGFAHFFEHMMFRGTKTYPGSVYDEMITEMGANANAYTTNDRTVYHLNFASEDLEKVMELESDRFRNLWYEEPDFKTEAGAVHGEYLKSLSNPWYAIYEEMYGTAFTRHTYQHTVIGFREDIEAMPGMYGYSQDFFKRYYRPDNVILLLAGDVNVSETMDLVESYYGTWEKGYQPPDVPEEPEQTREKHTTVSFNGKTLPILWIGYKGLAFDPESREMAACYLLGDLLFGETSDLYQKLVLDERRVQFIEADFSSSRDPDLLSITTMVNDEKDVDAVEADIEQTIRRYQTEPVDAKRLADLKSHMKYSFLMGLDTPEKVASGLAKIMAITGELQSVDTLYATLDAVTPADIQKAARTFLVREKRTVAVLKGRS